ncbi:mas-related G-protein coupled receptor member H-like isoform X3 [Molothrus aeneus]|uniref:mas-related G-protein coupled receptor member H-like isoform X3 n=1 Tax=Molothrus aeneus TaxID=84833 RepID=UPI0034595730
MEVTTVSPSPASPTEGDDLCDIDVTHGAIDSVTLLICLCGLAGNGAVLCLLQRTPTTCYIINLAFANFSFLHFAVPSTLLYLLEELSCSTVVPLVFMRALFPLLLFSYNLGLYLLTAISIDSLFNFLQQLGYTVVPSQVVFLLACIHSSINPFIYFLVGRCWRPCSVRSLQLSLQRVFEQPEENTAHSDDPAMDTAFPTC